MEARVEKINKGEWISMSRDAHLICFNEIRDPMMDRIDFALLSVRDEPLSYCTVRELDAESVYWQHGGSFPNTKGTGTAYYDYKRYAEWCFENSYKRVTTYIENNNLNMLKIALKVGFLIIGTRTFNGHIMLELLLEKERFGSL